MAETPSAPAPAPETDMREAILAKAPHMRKPKPGRKQQSAGGGFDISLDDGADDLDAEFTRRGAA